MYQSFDPVPGHDAGLDALKAASHTANDASVDTAEFAGEAGLGCCPRKIAIDARAPSGKSGMSSGQD